MNSLTQACLAFLTALSGFSQGQITFANLAPSERLDSPIYDVDCETRLFGASYIAQGYVGLTPDSLEPVFPLLRFYDDTARAGYIMAQLITVDGAGPRFVQLRAWEAAAGDSYEAAVATGGKHGVSNISPVEAVFPPGAPSITAGFQSFCLIPEPSAFVILLGGGLMMIALRFKRPSTLL